MNWTMKVPTHQQHLPMIAANRPALCATTDRGEYAILQVGNHFGVYLDGSPVTGLDLPDAATAMRKASELDEQLFGTNLVG